MARDKSMNFIGSKFFKGTALGPDEYLVGRHKRSRLMNQEEMERYDRKVKRTKGFDVDGCTGAMPGRIFPIRRGCREWDVSVYLATFAAETHFPDKRLEALSLDKATCQGIEGSMYFLTFTAKDIADRGKIKWFRAKVWRKPNNALELNIFKEFKPPQKAVVAPHKAQCGDKSSNRSKKSKEKKGGVAQRGLVLGGFRAVCTKLKEENPSWTHSKAVAAASDKWKSLSSDEKKFYKYLGLEQTSSNV